MRTRRAAGPGMRLGGLILLAALAAGEARADCTRLPSVQTRPQIAAFLVRPAGLLERFPTGGNQFSSTIRLFLSVDPTATLDPVVKLIPTANRTQKRDIGTGFAQAIQACNAEADSYAARRLQDAARRVSDVEFGAGFAQGGVDRATTDPRLRTDPSSALGSGSRRISNPAVSPFDTKGSLPASPEQKPLLDPFAPMR
ncbi:hypothetical protein [Methylobacterium oryzihabitans]|uniref:Uncharacterized protein n=1 Tax=Methylobacterium oryzihabitans TaxID=2499852 RepID=A0A437PE87_9HYPH|nr:hypothetical protein [Methylobacterium oryzihabitans]RVU20529.1 hypothetical protein EOE48_04045 [Methylobacterium oryzihabitans]